METAPAGKSAALSQQDPPQTKCPLTAALTAIGGKWSLICLYWLGSGTRRVNELRPLLPDISPQGPAAALPAPGHEGLILRTVLSGCPPRGEYPIFTNGGSVRPIPH